MQYRVSKPLRYFKIGAQMDIDPEHPLHARLIADGTLTPVKAKKKPKAAKRETKVVEPTEAKDDSQDN